MFYSITTKNFDLTKRDELNLRKSIYKLNKHLFLKNELMVRSVECILSKKHHRSTNNKTKKLMKVKKFSSPMYYHGKILLQLTHKTLVVNVSGDSFQAAVNDGIEKILIQYASYKGRYFKSDSTYFDKSTIRKSPARLQEIT